MKALTIEDIGVRFGGVQALNHLSLSVEEGERRAIIGPNGAGKTTFFNAISGTLAPDAGRVLLYDRDITRCAAHHRAALGLARTFQLTNLFPSLSVLDNLILGIQALKPMKYVFFRRTSSFRGVASYAESLLEEWGLRERRQTLVRHLSHGEHRQLEIVLAVASRPRVLLLDEPTQGLSTAETASVIPMLERIGRDTTILFIEHDMDVAFQVADRVSVLYFGQLLAEGDEAEIRSNRQVAEVYLGTAHLPTQLF
ncbi:MAG: ABC transporter ATP-binding protein [Deferrisomatales bacterium]